MLKGLIARIKAVFQVNWVATLKINFSMFAFKEAKRLPIMVHGKLKITDLSGEIIINCPLKRGLVIIGTQQEMTVTSYGTAQLSLAGKWIINGPFMIGQDVSIIIQKGGSFTIGEGSYLGNHTKLLIVNDVCFGNWVRFAYDSQLVSTNFHHMKNMITGKVGRMSKKGIVINDYCWIGNNSTIMPGSVLPEKSIVASHSLINKDFSESPQYPLIGGIPAKVISNGKCRVFNPKVDRLISDYFTEHPDAIEFDATELDIF